MLTLFINLYGIETRVTNMLPDPFFQELQDEHRIVKVQPFPNRWTKFCKKYNLTWNLTPFDKGQVTNISKGPGIYCFHIGHDLGCLPNFGLSLYGGMTSISLQKRCLDYFSERDSEKGRFWVRKFLKVFQGELVFAWSEVDNKSIDLNRLEKDFNDAMMPQYSIRDFSADVKAKKNAWS